MGILEKFFPAKTTITSATIKAEIDYSESEIARLNTEIGPKLAAIATMTDAEHVKVDADIAAVKRAITRLDARIAHLNEELPSVLAAEEAGAKLAVDEALRQRAEAARKANTVESKKLLTQFDNLASQIGDVLDKLKLIDAEREAVNAALRSNPVAEMVVGYDTIYRKHPDRQATEHREQRLCWVHHDGTATEAQKGATGEIIHPYHALGHDPAPQLKMHEIVVSRSSFRPGRTEPSLNDVRLPPAFAGGQWSWPRQ